MEKIDIMARFMGQTFAFYRNVEEALKKGTPVMILCHCYKNALGVMSTLKKLDISCNIKLNYNTNLSRPDVSNEDAVDQGYELHQDDQWGVYARKFTGLTLTKK